MLHHISHNKTQNQLISGDRAEQMYIRTSERSYRLTYGSPPQTDGGAHFPPQQFVTHATARSISIASAESSWGGGRSL